MTSTRGRPGRRPQAHQSWEVPRCVNPLVPVRAPEQSRQDFGHMSVPVDVGLDLAIIDSMTNHHQKEHTNAPGKLVDMCTFGGNVAVVSRLLGDGFFPFS